MTNPETYYPQEFTQAIRELLAGRKLYNVEVLVRAGNRPRIPATHILIHGEEYAVICHPPGAVNRHETKWAVKTNLTTHHVEYFRTRESALHAAVAYGVAMYPPLCEPDY